MQVMTPSLEYQDKMALAHVSKYADDCTGEIIDRDGNFRRGCTGMIHYIPKGAYERPWWREPNYPLKGCIERLVNACLLYTSPSPRDRQKSRMPSSA